MDITDLRNIGSRLQEEISRCLHDLRSGTPVGRGAGGDITHLIDKRAEDIVIRELEQLRFPVTLVSEECGVRDFFGGGPRLLLDPIDGSRNAVSGVPIFSLSIALIEGDTIGMASSGYVINLAGGDEFWALKGGGSYLNGRPLRTQQDDTFRVIAYEAQSPGRDIPRIMHLLSLFSRARCFGSTALDMAFLAQGALSVFVVPSASRSFDFAAGWLLIQEAGGIVTDLDGRVLDDIPVSLNRSSPLLASANENLHRKALAALKGR